MDLDDGPKLFQHARLESDFLLQTFQITLNRAGLPGDFAMAAAIKTRARAERDVQVERQRRASARPQGALIRSRTDPGWKRSAVGYEV